MSNWFIQPADVLFFRDGREIAPGSEYSADSVFPPNPQTLYGAIRSALLSCHAETDFKENDFGDIPQHIKDVVGTKKATGSLRIEKFVLATHKDGETQALYPLPLDVLKRKKAPMNQDAVVNARTMDLSAYGIRSNAPGIVTGLNWFTHQEGAYFEYQPVFIPEKQFHDYLLGKLGDVNESESLAFMLSYSENGKGNKPAPYFVKEPRMGIVIDDESGTVEEGKLFTTPFIRMNMDEGVGFLVSFKLGKNQLSANQMIRLGGDGKLASLIPVEYNRDAFNEKLKKALTNTTRFKAVVTTPAIFEKGWVPDGIDPETGKGTLNAVQVALKSASVGRYTAIGGWNVAENKPKPTQRAVTPGAVYYFETPRPLTGDDIERLHGQSICTGLNNDYQKQGIGIIQLGVA